MTPGTVYVRAFRESLRIPGIRHQEVRDRAQLTQAAEETGVRIEGP